MSLNRNHYTGIPKFLAILFKLTFSLTCKADMTPVIFSWISAYVSGILVFDGVCVRSIHQKIDGLGYRINLS